MVRLLVFLGAASVLSCLPRDGGRPTGSAFQPLHAVLMFSSEIRGALEPCGCSEAMRGGLARAAQQIHRARGSADQLWYIDAGNALFAARSLPEEAATQEERRARAVAAAFHAMGLAARSIGPFDDARGAAFRASLGLPEVAAGHVRFLEARGHVVALVAAETIDQAVPLAAAARKEGHGAFVIALVSAAPPLQAAMPSGASAIDLVLAAPGDASQWEENRLSRERPAVAQIQSRGRSVLRVDLFLREPGTVHWAIGDGDRAQAQKALNERIELLRAQLDEPQLDVALRGLRRAKLEELVSRSMALAQQPLPMPERGNVATARFIPLEASLPQDDAVRSVVRAYDADVGMLNLTWAKTQGRSCPPVTPTQPGFVGSTPCFDCHPGAAAAWKASKHARAFLDLEKQAKQYHLDCIRCHVTGWKEPGGVCRLDETQGRREVGCESCHGPGSQHLAAPVKGNVGLKASEEVCRSCHDAENSVHFDFDRYRAKVVAPGHGLPSSPKPAG